MRLKPDSAAFPIFQASSVSIPCRVDAAAHVTGRYEATSAAYRENSKLQWELSAQQADDEHWRRATAIFREHPWDDDEINRRWLLTLLAICLFLTLLSGIPFAAGSRLRTPLELMVRLLAAIGLVRGIRAITFAVRLRMA